MNGKKAKQIRRLIRNLGFQPGELMGDNRTVRYYWDVPVVVMLDPKLGPVTHFIKRVTKSDVEPVPGSIPLFTTYTRRYHPGSYRSTYQQAKEAARHA